MRSRMIATAALAAAFAMIPAGSALADSGPASAASERSTPKSTAPTPEGNPSSAKAQASGVCEDASQIGKTGYIKRGDETVASIKHYYSRTCEAHYSYVWLWQSFIDKEDNYDVSASVHNSSRDEELGKVTWHQDNGQEYWSERGDEDNDDCKVAKGTVLPEGSGTTLSGYADKSCNGG